MIRTQNIGIEHGARPEGRAAGGDEARLRQVADQFESMFMTMLMKSMRETVPMSDLIDNKGEIKYYRQMLDEEMSRHMASGPSGLGIATKIVEQFRTHLEAAGAGAPEASDAVQGPVPEASGRMRMKKALAAYTTAAGDAAKQAPGPADLHGRARAAGEAVADTLRNYETEILDASRKTDLDPELLLAVIMQESAGRADAESRAGARGLMQLMPGTAEELGVADPLDPSQNIDGGARYLAWLHDRFEGDLDLVLAGYNAGPGTVARAGNRIPDISETRGYVRKVSELYETLRADAGGGAAGAAERRGDDR